jgi:hypothetical protein
MLPALGATRSRHSVSLSLSLACLRLWLLAHLHDASLPPLSCRSAPLLLFRRSLPSCAVPQSHLGSTGVSPSNRWPPTQLDRPPLHLFPAKAGVTFPCALASTCDGTSSAPLLRSARARTMSQSARVHSCAAQPPRKNSSSSS